jgi:predicted aspartyl protease
VSKTKLYTFERKDYLFYIRAAIGGKDNRRKIIRLLIDTGARNTVVPARLLHEFGYNIGSPIRPVRIVAAGGMLQVPMLVVSWFSCLGINLQLFEVVALDLLSSAGVDDLLGMDFLTTVGAVVDIEQAQVSVKQNS